MTDAGSSPEATGAAVEQLFEDLSEGTLDVDRRRSNSDQESDAGEDVTERLDGLFEDLSAVVDTEESLVAASSSD